MMWLLWCPWMKSLEMSIYAMSSLGLFRSKVMYIEYEWSCDIYWREYNTDSGVRNITIQTAWSNKVTATIPQRYMWPFKGDDSMFNYAGIISETNGPLWNEPQSIIGTHWCRENTEKTGNTFQKINVGVRTSLSAGPLFKVSVLSLPRGLHHELSLLFNKQNSHPGCFFAW